MWFHCWNRLIHFRYMVHTLLIWVCSQALIIHLPSGTTQPLEIWTLQSGHSAEHYVDLLCGWHHVDQAGLSKRLLYTGGLGKEIYMSQRGWYMKNQGAATAVKSLRVQDIPAKVNYKFLASLFQKEKHSTWSVSLVSSEASTFYTQEYCFSPYARWHRGPPAFSGAFSRNGFCSSSRLPWHMGHMIPQTLWCCKCQ